ncbi:hypothetical protein QF026_003281 [Streptomyces aurantiacus]|nr:hypothetical protein [Streptomyces aurantiacus]
MAAAQDARDELMEGLEGAIGVDDDWLDWLDGGAFGDKFEGATAAAQQLAAENDSTVQGEAQRVTVGELPGFRVAIKTNFTVGDSIIPGTETKHAKADATAVIAPRCDFDLDADPVDPITLDCDGESVDIDPEDFDLDDLPDASVLFSVHLAE